MGLFSFKTNISTFSHAAGVFLIVRNSFIYEFVPNVLKFIAIIGAFTAFFASTTGLLQNDLKRVIAYSTASQLGYMICSCGLSNYSIGFFHLINHAFFKALLFLSAGSIIHGRYFAVKFTYTNRRYTVVHIDITNLFLISLVLISRARNFLWFFEIRLKK
jgi:NADH:ubiquinone oxidoreductase subunit 5 (subunit L)/multisubunit Na+/H+ antiporter MnhA subunit